MIFKSTRFFMNDLKIRFLFLYILLSVLIIFGLWLDKERKIHSHINLELRQVQLNYNAIYNDYHKIANLIFQTKIDTPKVIDIFKKANDADKHEQTVIRKELYNSLKKTYSLLQTYNLKQLHFHLPDNRSFLRFHRPNKFGDDLSPIRKTIEYVNKNFHEIDGFEEGRIYNGYRFVYPLFDGSKKYIGSVEISFSTLAMLSSYQKAYKNYANFILPQKIVDEKLFKDEKDNYIRSNIDGFVIEKDIYRFNKNKKEYRHTISHLDYQSILNYLKDKKSFTLYDNHHENFFLPVLNPIDHKMEGLFIVKQEHHYILNKQKNFFITSIIILILLALAMYYFYKSQQYKRTIIEKNAKLRTVIEQADSGIAIMDLHGNFLDVNAMYSELLGYSKKELLQLSCIKLTDQDEQNEATRYLQEAKKKGAISKVHKICKRKDGSRINLEFSLTLLPSHKHFIAVINSMEEKLKLQKLNDNLQEEVEKVVKELRRKDELLLKQSKDAAMGEMIDAIAHQWKNPLGIIRMLAQTIKLEYELDNEPEITQIIQSSSKIEEQIDHLLETLEEFRSFFRPKATQQEITIDTLINSVNILLKDELIKNTIQIVKKGDISSKITIYPNEFKHVLINLINNSRDAFIENKITDRIITYTIHDNNDTIVIELCDNAGGIPDKILPKIFDANFTTKEQGKGTGIGLYMTKQILDKIKASIKVHNSENGTCFQITIKKDIKPL